MADFFSGLNETVNSILDPLLDPNVRPFVMLFLTMFGGLAAPKFPAKLQSLAGNMWFRILWLSMIVWIANRDPGVAVAATVAFIGILNVSNKRGIFEMFSGNQIENFEGPNNAIYPGCMNMTVYDLLESFKNDKDALVNAMLVARVPTNVTVTDYYAPLIATYLLNKGFALKSPCSPPGVEQRIGAWM